jgi:predicted ribosome quality control (RQC) complex YloA/Tae2 family protein
MASKGKGYRTIERDGWEILVGKGASDNDELSLKIAEPLDYWFHVDDYSGSHVIVRCPGGITPPHEIVRYAAALAAWHSKARGAKGKVDVHQCLARDVRKPRGYEPGKVQISNWSSIKIYVRDPDE